MSSVLQLRVQADHSATPAADGKLPPTGQVRIDSDDVPKEHQFGAGLVAQGQTQGWLELDAGQDDTSGDEILQVQNPKGTTPPWSLWSVQRADTITLHTIDGDVVYEVTREPGIYDDGGFRLKHKQPLNGDGTQPLVEVFLGYDVELKADNRTIEKG